MPEDENFDGKPVFLINGFLDAGKTRFLKFTMQQEYFQTDGETLLILCEEGEEEYPEELLKSTHTTVVRVDKPEEMTKQNLARADAVYDPERVIIEWNGMWPQDNLVLPDSWFMNQVITINDTTMLQTYLNNLKPLMGQMLRYSELVINNRADDIPEDTLSKYMLSLKAMARNGEIIFEGAQGEIRGDFNIELPYDINADTLKIANDDFGIFYLDAMDRPDRYAGKRAEYVGQVLRPEELGPGVLVVGRMCMTCCEADMQFLGPVVRFKGASGFQNGDWVKVKGVIKAEELEEYGGPGAVIYAEEIVRTSPVKGVVSF